ncbi:hypothetical protein MNBD_GAMMA09-930 [hydrothermal vent metagenome]|uniref:Uncharacterized protein n=1 Tax=hydrothermal vent metagenome TaxID=652676 RepID=A0A3B0XIR1_9ZZZZ
MSRLYLHTLPVLHMYKASSCFVVISGLICVEMMSTNIENGPFSMLVDSARLLQGARAEDRQKSQANG